MSLNDRLEMAIERNQELYSRVDELEPLEIAMENFASYFPAALTHLVRPDGSLHRHYAWDKVENEVLEVLERYQASQGEPAYLSSMGKLKPRKL